MRNIFRNKLKFCSWALGLAFVGLTACSDSEFTTVGCEGDDCGNTKLSFSWEESSWSGCSKACGGGEQTRTVVCKDSEGNNTAETNCPGTKPATSMICNAQACSGSFTWLVGEFGTCSQTCGGGDQSRSVLCKDSDNLTTADNKCPSPKPLVTQQCNTHVCPNHYSWRTTNWSQCSKACGNGTQTRTTYCAGPNDAAVDDNLCTGTKPITERLCNTQACTATHGWFTGEWSSCSKSCGTGQETRAVACLRDDGQFVASSFCTDTKPVDSRVCNTQACGPQCIKKTINANVESSDNLLDVLVVVDDSGSMAQDNMKLANKLKSFADDLENRCNINWQMCITTTDVGYYKGRPLMWQSHNGSHILKTGTPNLSTIFVNTMKWIGHGWSTDEQGIKAMNMSVMDNFRSKCYRPNAALSVVVISDEDERSVGGNQSLSTVQYQPLEPLNLPSSFPKTVRDTFGANKKFNVNSIVVKDSQCKSSQDAQGAGAKSFYGTKYLELSALTQGGTGSICDADYSDHLKLFANKINRTMASIKLQCRPTKAPEVILNPMKANQTLSVIDDELIFTPVIKGPASITGSYCCAQ